MKLKSLRAIVTSPYIYKHVCVCPHRVCETIEIKCKNKVLKPNVFAAEREGGRKTPATDDDKNTKLY